ncbi:MAG: group II intron reverse transcriptase/maturase [Cetobacterium sp.]
MSLVEQIIDERNIYLAIEKLKSNKGSMTPGVNGETIENIIKNKELVSKRIRKELSEEKYQPQQVRRVDIPKGNGKTRPLGIPVIYDRVVQQCFKQILEPILERKFYKNSFGFRPNRSTENAIALCHNMINNGKLHFVVDIDIKGFFDNINHNKLIKQLKRFRSLDEKTLSLIKTMLQVEIILPNREIEYAEKGTPQGGILSPLLSNVVLNELDWWIHSKWSGIKTKRKYSIQGNKEKALKKNSNLKEVKIVRYADDFKLFCRDRGSAEKYFKLVKIFLKERLKLEISKEKSKIVNLRKQSSDFLGIKIKAIKNRNKYTARSHISNKAKKQMIEKIKLEIKELQKKRTIKQSLKFNSVILGIQNYYRMATMVNIDLAEIGYIVNKSLMSRIGNYSWKKDLKYSERYKGYKYQVWTVAGITLFTLQACKFKIPRLFSAKKKIEVKEILIEKEEEQFDIEKLRAILRSERNSTCEVTGNYIKGINNFYVHWLIPKEQGGTADFGNLMLLEPQFKDLLKSKDAKTYYKDNKNYQKILKTLSKNK